MLMISSPHSWYTIEDYNNKLYVELTKADQTKSYTVLTIPEGNYTGPGLSGVIELSLRLVFMAISHVSVTAQKVR